MIQHIHTQIFETANGWVVSVWFDKGLAALTLPQESPGEANLCNRKKIKQLEG